MNTRNLRKRDIRIGIGRLDEFLNVITNIVSLSILKSPESRDDY